MICCYSQCVSPPIHIDIRWNRTKIKKKNTWKNTALPACILWRRAHSDPVRMNVTNIECDTQHYIIQSVHIYFVYIWNLLVAACNPGRVLTRQHDDIYIYIYCGCPMHACLSHEKHNTHTHTHHTRVWSNIQLKCSCVRVCVCASGIRATAAISGWPPMRKKSIFSLNRRATHSNTRSIDRHQRNEEKSTVLHLGWEH